MPEPILYKIAASLIPNLGAVNMRNIISYCGSVEQVFKSKKSSLLKIPGVGENKANAILNSDALIKAEIELKKIQDYKIDPIFYLDKNYPPRLRNYSDAPLILYTKGNISCLKKRTVAIVGTRKVTSYGILECEKLIEQLYTYDCTIISGLAYGVDTIAHRKSVELGLPTIGVLGHGINKLYPKANLKLGRKMIDHGALISEYPMDTPPDRVNFPRRNRVIAALADAVVVVESAIKGGSIITAEYANEYSKDVFAIPGKLTDEFSTGCNFLIKTHKAHLCQSADDLAYIMRWDKEQEAKQLNLIVELDEIEKPIYDLIHDNQNIGLDKLHYMSKTPLGQLTSLLLKLEFRGLIKSLPGKKYILTS